jgi:large subunit ribosomal protein L25
MEQLNLVAERREPGKHSAKRARRNGKVPGILYGYGRDNVSVQFDALTLIKLMQTEHTLVSVQLDGQRETAVIRDYDQDPVSGKVTHIDIMTVRMDKPIDVWVPILFIGTPIGVRTKGGIIQHDMTELHIKSLPADIPGHLEVNVEELDLGRSIHVRDLQFEKITILNPATESICTVVAPKALEAVLAEAQAEPTEPELVGEKGKEEAAEEGEPAEKPEKAEKAEKK